VEDTERKVPPAGTREGASEEGAGAVRGENADAGDRAGHDAGAVAGAAASSEVAAGPGPAARDVVELSSPAVETGGDAGPAPAKSVPEVGPSRLAEGAALVRRWRQLSPLARTVVALAGGAAVLGAALAAWAVLGPLRRGNDASALPAVSGAPAAASVAGSAGLVDPLADAGLAGDASDDAGDVDGGPSREPAERVWRVARLADDSTVSVQDVTVGRRPLFSALAAAHVRRDEAQRLVASLDRVRSADRVGPKDTLTVALDKASGRVVAYELASSPVDVWQGREVADVDGGLLLETHPLKLSSERVRVGKAIVVGTDLRASLVEAGLTPVDDVLAMLDDALDGHAEPSAIRSGARLRIVATQEQVDGAFVRWLSLEAVEYFPATGSPSVRVYSLGDADDGDGRGSRHGWYDAKGRQPYRGGWRTPVPMARIASRFNPHRMHPVLHVVMPHNGVDFAAPVGARVYATAAGTVTAVGFDGPCGNRVEIAHAGGISSVYCHLSRFAAGLRAGQRVEPRQLIAYVGQTGRVTGPHLHFGIKRNGVFIDPLTLRYDGVNLVPRALRDEFDRHRAALDAELDDIPLPAAAGAAPEAAEPETIYEEP
jgi:hypothetical protein